MRVVKLWYSMANSGNTQWTKSSLQTALNEVVSRVGPWTAHSISLGHGIHTREPEVNWRVELFGRIMRDFGLPQTAGLRILDLACLEGLFAIEFARQGAITVGVEGRQTNVEKAVFAKDVLGLSNCTIVRDDVRNLSSLNLGQFDVVLCAGILYHLEANDAFDLIRQISGCCRRLAIFDTHIAPEYLIANSFSLSDPMSSVSIEGQAFDGRYYTEHAPSDSARQKEAKLWASLDNERSFWFSKASLFRALQMMGFAGVYDSLRDIDKPLVEIDRVIFAALK